MFKADKICAEVHQFRANKRNDIKRVYILLYKYKLLWKYKSTLKGSQIWNSCYLLFSGVPWWSWERWRKTKKLVKYMEQFQIICATPNWLFKFKLVCFSGLIGFIEQRLNAIKQNLDRRSLVLPLIEIEKKIWTVSSTSNLTDRGTRSPLTSNQDLSQN